LTATRLVAIILTRNEARDLPACLESLVGLTDQIYVIDSGSTDATLDIARRYRAHILEHAFVNYATQFNWALDQLPAEDSPSTWVLRIDADERVSAELKTSLLRSLPVIPERVSGISMARRTNFLGKSIRWGDTYPVWLLRIWRADQGRCEDTWMDEHIILKSGDVMKVSGDLIHDIPKSLSEWTSKHNWYADRECADILATSDPSLQVAGQAKLKRWIKQNLYLRLPLFSRPLLYWIYRYFFKLGFLDGKQGLIYHFLHAFWYRFLVDAKLYEIQRASQQPQPGGAQPAAADSSKRT